MILIVAGSRTITDPHHLDDAMAACGWAELVTEVISGCEPRGVDRLGERWAESRGIPVKRFPAAWSEHGKKAGPMRNTDMIIYAKAHQGRLLVCWDGASKGTGHCLGQAKVFKVPSFIWYV